ncbi:LPS export ABC transporter periplasmic protein LptC [Cyanobium sp. NIES-981]|uniref:LPS export ABC transporter periplasmic protein LptC n=1 Tax=Cyanobium sp. NIES-981 TaxID=1851505 RepID=UPI0007DCEB08|nr:LPS export ABC transporter periplasmic protein LptC [Cyanobium sp. NIES-981]SBO42299.1 conserved protein of unknown function [Cyanobium sp. NIES-981]
MATGLGLTLLLASCASPPAEPEAAPPFVFRSLDLRQQDGEGRTLWELTSPETRYDLSRRVAQARDLRGVLYSQGKPLYRFTAANGVVLNDGELVQLEGPTRVQRLEGGERPLVITALRVRWYPARKLMELDRAPVATQDDLRLTSRRVRFLIGEDRLELVGTPTLVRSGVDPLRLVLSRADWSPGSGALRGRGPVQGERAVPDRPPQRLTAPSLTANTRSRTIDLQAPVRVVDPGQKGELLARSTRMDLQRRLITSDEPFEGRLGQSTLRGTGFALNFASTTVVVPSACQLNQPGESLRAERCQWNWATGAVEASGDVTLRRRENDQVTRAERLTARAEKDGFVQFGGPGARVRTQLRLPEAPGRPRDGRAAPAPIGL